MAVSFLLAQSYRLLGTTTASIAGDSMPPALHGPHGRVPCQRCRFPIEFGFQHAPDLGLVTCSNCGFRKTPFNESHWQAADRVRIVPLELAGPVRRFDVIAFHAPGGGLAVKRVVALPGESPSILGGDVFIDEQRVAKSIETLRAVAVPVHDNRFRPAITRHKQSLDYSRWIASPDGQIKTAADGMITLNGSMRYRHRAISTVALPGTEASDRPDSIRDFDAYNQSLSRSLNTVADVLLSGEFRVAESDTVTISVSLPDQGLGELTIKRQLASVRWNRYPNHFPDSATGGAQVVLEDTEPIPLKSGRWHSFSLAVADGRFLASIDGIETAFDLPPSDAKPPSPRFTITATRVELRHLRIERDIYYLHPHLTGSPWSLGRPLDDDEYFVLGDNSPASTDSRHWQNGIRCEQILGKVFPVKE